MSKTFFLTQTGFANFSHVATNEAAIDLTAGDSTVLSDNLSGGESKLTHLWTGTSDVPNDADWPTGVYSASFNVTGAGADITYGCRTAGSVFGHIANWDTVLGDQGAVAQIEPLFSGTGIKTATTGTITPAPADANDRFEVLVAATRASNHGNQSLDITCDSNSTATGPWGGGSFTLTAALATYALAQPDTNTEWGHSLDAILETYALAETNTTLSKGFLLAADLETYALAQTNTGLTRQLSFIADLETYALAETNTTLSKGFLINADLATYSLVEQTTILNRNHVLDAALNTYSLVELNTNTEWGHLLTADLETYTLAQTNTALSRQVNLAADLETYSLAQTNTNTEWGHSLDAILETYALVQTNTGLLRGHSLDAALETYSLAQTNTTLTQSGAANSVLTADLETYSYTPIDTALSLGRVLDAALEAYSLAETNTGLSRQVAITCNLESYVLVELDIVLTWGRVLAATLETYALSGQPAVLSRNVSVSADLVTYSLVETAITILRSHVEPIPTTVYSLRNISADLLWSGQIRPLLPHHTRPFSVVLTDRVTGILYDVDRTPGNFVGLTPYTKRFGEIKYPPHPAWDEPHINPPGGRVYVENGVAKFEQISNDKIRSEPINNQTAFRDDIYELGLEDGVLKWTKVNV